MKGGGGDGGGAFDMGELVDLFLFIGCLSLMNFYCQRSRSHRVFYLS
jgi:hypothetical protein